jgi:hypothetical protein
MAIFVSGANPSFWTLRNKMRTKFLLTLCLAALPMCLVGCDSGAETTVGTGSNEPPPDVKKRIEEQANMYKKMQEDAAANPTPSDGRAAPPPGGG